MSTDNKDPNDDEKIPDLYDHKANEEAALNEKFRDLMIPGFVVEFSPEEAEKAGAFFDDSLTEEEALASSCDLLNRNKPQG